METKRKYYAEKSPRGFDNQWNFFEFPDKKTRDDFVKEGYGDITTSEEVRRVMRRGPKGQYNLIIPVEISHVTKRACELSGALWVDEYRKTDGTMVKGYCIKKRWDLAMDQECWQLNEREKRRKE